MEETKAQVTTPLPQKISCGTGSVLNEFFRQMCFSYELLFLIKVVGLSGSQAGLIMMLAQACDGALGPLVGYLSDQITLPLISRPLGKRKAWHLVGVLLMSIFFPFLFARCLLCGEGASQWFKFAYYLTLDCLCNFAYSIIDIGHLSMIAVFAKDQEEAVHMNVARTLFTYGGGVCAYGVTLIVFGQDSEENLSSDSWRNFLIINCTLVGVGILFSGFVFHIGTKEPKEALPRRKVSSVLTKHGLISAAMIFIVGSDLGDEKDEDVEGRKLSFPLRKDTPVLQFINDWAVGSELQEPDSTAGKASAVRKESSASRKLSAARKISAYIVPFDTGLVEHDSGHEPESAKRASLRVVREDEAQRKEDGHRAVQTADIQQPEIGQMAIRKSSLPEKVVAACHVPEISKAKKSASPKSRIRWLKDPHLYKVSVIYAITRLIQDFTYSYMSFYLIDYLLVRKEATAIFPLILLICGLFGTALAKWINKKLGGKWTYCISAALVVGAAVWFYFLAPSSRSVAYAPTIIVGSGMSAMYVMTFNFITALIGDDKETSGFVCSVTGLTAKLASGVFFVTVQYFYPSTSEGKECPDCGAFARHALALSLGILSLLGLLIVLIFQKSPPIRKPSSSQGRIRKIGRVETRPGPPMPNHQQETYDTKL